MVLQWSYIVKRDCLVCSQEPRCGAGKVAKKNQKLFERLVGEDPSLASVAQMFLYQNDALYKLEVLASVLNDVAPGSPDHAIAEMIEKLVTIPPAQQEWTRQAAF